MTLVAQFVILYHDIYIYVYKIFEFEKKKIDKWVQKISLLKIYSIQLVLN